MANSAHSGINVEQIDGLSIVSLRVFGDSLDDARERMQLAQPLYTDGADPATLWVGPDQWLLVSASVPAVSLVSDCNEKLTGVLHNAVDVSAGLAVFRFSGPDTRRVLAAGSGLDFRPEKFQAGSCCRTRFAQIAAIIVQDPAGHFDAYVDRSYHMYLNNWLIEAIDILSHG